jgi:hypothetical protein
MALISQKYTFNFNLYIFEPPQPISDHFLGALASFSQLLCFEFPLNIYFLFLFWKRKDEFEK